jgi:putative peptidoglycan lipid II flippase
MISGPLLSTLFQYGHFDAQAVMMSRKSLSAFSIGITPFMLVKILSAGFYAKQEMRIPVKIAVAAMLTNILFNIALIVPLAHAGIALATSLSAIINTVFLFYFLRNRGYYQPRDGWKLFSIRLLTGNTLLAVWLWMAAGEMSIWLRAHAVWRLTHLIFLLMMSILIYFAALWATGIRLHHLLIPAAPLSEKRV